MRRARGNGDERPLGAGNSPADEHGKRVVRLDGHDAPRILDAILSVMPVDDMVPEAVWRPAAHGDASRIEPVFADFLRVLRKHEPAQHIVPLVGDAFYGRVKACYAVVASSEPRLYGNIILRKGVIYPA